jgi:hypothetical protein
MPVMWMAAFSLLLAGTPALDAVVDYLRGMRTLQRTGCAAAMPAFESAVRADVRHADAWLELARCRGRLGNIKGKIKTLRRAVAASPASDKLRHELGLAYVLAGDRPAALAVAQELRAAKRIDAAAKLELLIWTIITDPYGQPPP